nr:hypothetical protein [Tanacetum cinerariifolium]
VPVTVASPVGVLELNTHSSSKADPSKSSLPPVSVAPMVLPFLCSDDSESAIEIPKRHVSPTPHDAMLTRWRSRVALQSSSPTTSIPEIPNASILPAPSAIVAPSSESSPGDSSFESFAGPSCKRFRSPATTMTSSILDTRALVPSRADLLPPRKRFRDSISPEESVEEDIDTDVLDDIEADATVVEVAVDRNVKAGIDAVQRGTMEVRVDMVDGIDIRDGIPLQRIDDIETGQRDLEARSMIDGGERASLLDQVASLERSNTRLRGIMMMERARADRFWRRVRFLKSELRQIRRFRYYDKMRSRRLKTFDVRRLEMLFVEYTEIKVKQFRETLLLHMGNVKKSVAERTRHKRHETKSDEHITSSSSGTYITHVVDEDIRPLNDQEPSAEVHLVAQHNVLANEQQHTDQSEPSYDTYLLEKVDSNTTSDSTNMCHGGGEIDKDAEQDQVKSSLLKAEFLKSNDIVEKEVYNELSNKILQLEKHCISLEISIQQKEASFQSNKPFTPHYLPKVRKSVFVNPNHVIAYGSSRNSSKESWWWRGDVDDDGEGGNEVETVVRWCSDDGGEESVVVSVVAWRLSRDGGNGVVVVGCHGGVATRVMVVAW